MAHDPTPPSPNAARVCGAKLNIRAGRDSGARRTRAIPRAFASLFWVFAGLSPTLASSAFAAPEPGPTKVPELRRSDDVPRAGAVWFSHRGSFRFRSELLLGGDLGNGASSIPEPIGTASGADDSSTLTWASIRLRYEPTIHVGPDISVHLGLDALDNIIMGSTHEAAGGDLSIGLLGDSQAPPSSGRNGWRDALSVRQAYARWLAVDAIELRGGRMIDHFGLGILRNGGFCEDCDFGTVVDRVSLGLSLSGFRLEAAWEFTAVGLTSDFASEVERQAGGQATDLGLGDDVTTYVVKAGQYPATQADHAARSVLLDDTRGWAVDWAVFASFTDQGRSSLEPPVDNTIECGASETLANGLPVSRYDCVRLVRRDAFFLRPGFWLRAEHRPSLFETFRFELEASALLGSVAHPQRLFEEDPQEAKDFVGFGLAGELEWKRQATTFGFDFGFATGDDGPYVGVLDGNNVVDPDDDGYPTNDAIRNNRTITSFHFNRDYRLDLILFRQLLGAVTNAVYFKPYISHELLSSEGSTVFVRLDALYAAAMRPSGTPGGGDHWGLEFDGRIGFESASGFAANLALGLLLPFDALNDPLTGDAPDPAFAMRGYFGWKF